VREVPVGGSSEEAEEEFVVMNKGNYISCRGEKRE
jgi:hypothetical protein